MLEATMSAKLKFNLQSLTNSLPERLWDDAYGGPEQKEGTAELVMTYVNSLAKFLGGDRAR